MDWKKLLSRKRLGADRIEPIQSKRSSFQQDFDRIIFSTPFRALQDKTQVFPLSETDYVRTRLTHSLEASSIGRSLGTAAGAYVTTNYDTSGIHPSDFGAIVAAATLAHDIGNPPLGHAGEEAVQYWFKNSPIAAVSRTTMKAEEICDIEFYEGNAQGFRILANLNNRYQRGGMQLTCATLGAFAKYPSSAAERFKSKGIAGKKFNFFDLDKELFAEVAKTVGLKQLGDYSFARHPLAFLVEAADDIAYRIVDFEDGVIANRINYQELEELFCSIIKDKNVIDLLKNLPEMSLKIEFLRARAIGKLVDEAIDAFKKHHQELLAGEFDISLIDAIPSSNKLKEIYRRSAEDIYTTPRVIEVMAAGFELFSGMLDIFVDTCNDIALNGSYASPRSQRLIHLLPNSSSYIKQKDWQNSSYIRIMYVLDYISSMSDSFALSLYKKLKGTSL